MTKLLLLMFLAQHVATVPHSATLYYQSTSCTSSNPCSIQVYRAVCPTPSTCPQYHPGASNWTRLSSGQGIVTPTQTNTTWIITDNDPVLQDNTTYVYVATNSYQSTPTAYSGPSPSWSGTTSNGGTTNVPPGPTNGVGNSVN